MSDDHLPRSSDGSDEGAEPVVAERVRPVDLRDYARFDEDGARRVRILATDVLTIDLWCLQPWQATDVLLYDEVDVAYTVLGGNAWFVTDEGEIGLGPLGAILVPATVAHGLDNRTADPLVVLASGSPPDVPVSEIVIDEPVEEGTHAVHDPGESGGITDRLRALFRPPQR